LSIASTYRFYPNEGETMTPQAPAPGLVAYEPNPTVTNVNSGAVQTLNPQEYATKVGALAVIGWLSKDPRTSAWGPFTLVEVNQSNPWWKYSCPLRQIQIGCGMQFDAALWYSGLSMNSPALVQSMVDEMGTYATGQVVGSAF
jgi:hypothetical protein